MEVWSDETRGGSHVIAISLGAEVSEPFHLAASSGSQFHCRWIDVLEEVDAIWACRIIRVCLSSHVPSSSSKPAFQQMHMKLYCRDQFLSSHISTSRE